jgi:hypothetical protein
MSSSEFSSGGLSSAADDDVDDDEYLFVDESFPATIFRAPSSSSTLTSSCFPLEHTYGHCVREARSPPGTDQLCQNAFPTNNFHCRHGPAPSKESLSGTSP